MKSPSKIQICANCKHLKILDRGREFEGILDTEFIHFQCEVFGRQTKEYYLMAPVPTELPDKPFVCEFWEDRQQNP
ncbi:MAG: hypothetical protein HYU64_15520 [Armatimonadetes bacterium]|nr:hypothetical protein [Armatimonadota bacterium]